MRDVPYIAATAEMRRAYSAQLDAVQHDHIWEQLDRLVATHGFTHWSYVAAPTCSQRQRLRDALRVTAYPRRHVDECERHGLFAAIPSLAYAFVSDRSTYYSVVRDSAAKSKALTAFCELNQRFDVARGILIPLTNVHGARAALGLAFGGSSRELEDFWHDRKGAVLAACQAVHFDVLTRHLPTFSRCLLPDLTPRKRQLLRALADGCTTAEAADRLGISIFTVNKHIAELKRVLHARTTAHLTALATRYNLTD